MNFIDEILESSSELEPPTSFWYWSALATISAAVKDNVWITRGGSYYKLYPNIYVMLHADSGLRKGPPISLAKDLIKRVNNTRLITGRSSIQGILKELGTAETQPGGKVVVKSTAFIASSELTSSLVEDKAAADILTDLYDRHYNEGDWKSLLKMETFKLKDPTITMLTATNEAHSEDFFSKRDVQGGYFARTFIIHESEWGNINSLARPIKKEFNREHLAEHLRQLAQLQGPFKPLHDITTSELTPVGKIFDDWYMNLMTTIRDQKIKDPTGTINRFGDSVLKVAMLLSLSDGISMEISESHMKEAISKCEKLIGNARRTTLSRGKSNLVNQKAMIIHELVERENHTISRTQLLKKFWMHFDSKEWDELIFPSLNTAGLVNIMTFDNSVCYFMPDDQVKEMKNFLEGKNK